MSRKASIDRKTKETAIKATVDLDGTGAFKIKTGVGFLDLTIFLLGPQPGSAMMKFLASAPHLALGGFAMFAGFVLSKRS